MKERKTLIFSILISTLSVMILSMSLLISYLNKNKYSELPSDRLYNIY